MVDISLNLKKTAAIQEIDGSALIRLIDYCDENESRPGYGHEYKHIGGHKSTTNNKNNFNYNQEEPQLNIINCL